MVKFWKNKQPKDQEVEELEKNTEANLEEDTSEENTSEERVDRIITDAEILENVKNNISDNNPFKLKLQKQLDEVISKI